MLVAPGIEAAGIGGIVPTESASGSVGLITDIGATKTVISGVATLSELSETMYVIASTTTLTSLEAFANSGFSMLRSTFWYTAISSPRSHFCVPVSHEPLQFVV